MTAPPALLANAEVRLRRSMPADAEALYDATSDEAVTRFMVWPRHADLTVTQAFFDGCAERWEQGVEYHWIIETPAEHQAAGCMGLRLRGHEADFGYFLRPGYWGRGLATAASALVIDWLKRQPQVFRIWATTDTDNSRSLRTLERGGLKREGTLRMATLRPNISRLPRDTALFGLCRADF